MTNKKIDLGEYVVTIYHNEEKEILEVRVLDELGDVIEEIVITSDDDEPESEDKNGINFNLN